MNSEPPQSFFFQLPLEIRLEIYKYLLIPPPPDSLGKSEFPDQNHGLVCGSRRDHVCGKAGAVEPSSSVIYRDPVYHHPLKLVPTLEVRTLDPERFLRVNQSWKFKRTTFFARADRFRGRTMETTYWVQTEGRPRAEILRVNHQAHREAASILYSKYVLDFDVYADTVAPFIIDLTKEARSWVRSVAITKRATPFEKEFDRAEWTNACQCLANMPALEELKLQIIASKPSREGWHGIEPVEKGDMEEMITNQSFEWVRDLLKIKGLKKLDIKAKVEKCMSPGSDALYDWVRFSKSIEGSFRDVVREVMIRNGTVGTSNSG